MVFTPLLQFQLLFASLEQLSIRLHNSNQLTVDGRTRQISYDHQNEKHNISINVPLQNITPAIWLYIKEDHFGEELDQEQIRQLKCLLERHKDLFAESTADFSETSVIKRLMKVYTLSEQKNHQ